MKAKGMDPKCWSNTKISSSKKNPSERTAIWKQKQQDKIVALGGHF